MKKIIISFLMIGSLWTGWYLFSPIFIDKEIVEELPEEFILTDEKIILEDVSADTKTEIDVITNEALTEKTIEPEIDVSSEPSPVADNRPTEISRGNFEKVDYDVKGSFSVLENNGKSLLRIENLDITNGPDLFLVLSNKKPKTGNRDFVIINELKANQGSFNVSVPENVNFKDYKYLLIHCKQFSHTFAAAEIQ